MSNSDFIDRKILKTFTKPWRAAIGLFIALACSVASGAPPEGLENFALLGRGKGSFSLAPSIGYQRPAFRDDFETLQAYGGVPLGLDYLSFGAKTLMAPHWGDRSAYFLRYDFTMFKITSFGFKYIYENWKYIASSKDTVSAEYNIFMPFGSRSSGLYFSFGGYYRWLKQRWNDNWWQPFNSNTNDQEGYFIFTFGWQKALGSGGSYFTIDVNNRDQFSVYTADNLAFDLGINFVEKGFAWRILLGVRTSALLMGTGQVSETYFNIGYLSF